MGEKVAIVGSRGWKDHEMIRDYVYSLSPDDTVITGGAKGADQFAEIYARERGLAVLVFRPDWKQHGKAAGLVRNRQIVDKCDRLVAFWDGQSTGTNHGVGLARDAEKGVIVFRESDA